MRTSACELRGPTRDRRERRRCCRPRTRPGKRRRHLRLSLHEDARCAGRRSGELRARRRGVRARAGGLSRSAGRRRRRHTGSLAHGAASCGGLAGGRARRPRAGRRCRVGGRGPRPGAGGDRQDRPRDPRPRLRRRRRGARKRDGCRGLVRDALDHSDLRRARRGGRAQHDGAVPSDRLPLPPGASTRRVRHHRRHGCPRPPPAAPRAGERAFTSARAGARHRGQAGSGVRQCPGRRDPRAVEHEPFRSPRDRRRLQRRSDLRDRGSGGDRPLPRSRPRPPSLWTRVTATSVSP